MRSLDHFISFRRLQSDDEYFQSEVDVSGNYQVQIASEEIFTVEIERNGQIIYTDQYEVHATGGVATTYHQDFFIDEGGTPVSVTEYTDADETEMKVENPDEQFHPKKIAVIKNIYFDHGTSQLKKSSTPLLETLLRTMQKSPKLRIEIAGHTDNTGFTDVNAWLLQRRSEAIQKWLAKKGITASRIVPKGYGESKPIASNDDEKDGRELNRRMKLS